MFTAIILFFKCLFSGNNDVSSKRFITISCTATLIVVVLVDLFTKLTPSEFVFSGLTYVIMLGLGSVASERFSKNNNNEKTEIK